MPAMAVLNRISSVSIVTCAHGTVCTITSIISLYTACTTLVDTGGHGTVTYAWHRAVAAWV